MNKEEYAESVKDELDKLIGQDNYEYYEKSFTKQEVQLYISELCIKLKDFDGDIWQLAEVVASTIFEICHPELPGSGLVAYLVIKIFKQGAKYVCDELSV